MQRNIIQFRVQYTQIVIKLNEIDDYSFEKCIFALMKKLFLIVIGIFLAFPCVKAQLKEVVPYKTIEEMPNVIHCLPSPPDSTSAAFTYDVLRYMWGKEQRSVNPERTAIARSDAPYMLPELFGIYTIPLGLEISQTDTPELWTLLVKSLATLSRVCTEAKKQYHRVRPFVFFNDPLLTGGKEEDEEKLRHSGSFPSGHSARAWLSSLLLSEICPECADTIVARGWMYGESRVIVGAHWQSDVDIAREIATVCYASLQTCPAFRSQMERAQAEFRKKTRKR